VPIPNPGLEAFVRGLDGVASADLWAVGDAFYSGHDHALVEHWNGASWSKTRTPGRNAELNDVTAMTAGDAWAVGFKGAVSGTHAYTMHWNGVRWKAFPQRNRGGSDYAILNKVDGVAHSDVWAVGFKLTSDHSKSRGLIEHWDGTRWSIVPSVHTRHGETLEALAALSTTDVWALGRHDNSAGGTSTFAEHWDGTGWSQVHIANPGRGLRFITGAEFASPSDGWAVGYRGPTNTYRTLVEHWDGIRWTLVPSIDVARSDTLNDVALTPTTVWAVGGDLSNRQTLVIERCR
jgi:hypothetical protein